MIPVINFNNKDYPLFQSQGHASKFIIPFAREVCKGVGYDIGCMKPEWALPGAIPIDKDFDDELDAYNLPEGSVDFIFSSHCLEHLEDWVSAMDYWYSLLKQGGVLFLYLPDYSQEYWRPWNNRKHFSILSKEIMADYMGARGYKSIFSGGPDLNHSFAIMGEK